MDYFDLHCDTAFELWKGKTGFQNAPLHISGDKLAQAGFGNFIQIFAVWSDRALSGDECYANFFEIRNHLLGQLDAAGFLFCREKRALAKDHPRKALLSVEGARLLGNDVFRLEALRESGVRLLTLGYEGISAVCGAYDTDAGLTDFGCRVLEKCEELGIVADVSHISDPAFGDVTAAARRPFVATHSNSRQVFAHRRNLTDRMYGMISERGGIIGASLAPQHIAGDGTCLSDLLGHIRHNVETFGAGSQCAGFDLDGIASVPRGFSDIRDVPAVYRMLTDSGISKTDADKIFYGNAYEFFMRNL